jgi:Poly-beta-hydroxybutyrate polymerase N terminal
MPNMRAATVKQRHARALEMTAGIMPVTEEPSASGHAPEQTMALETPVDRILHSALARLSSGLSPMGIAEAWFGWAVHLGASPGRMAEIIQAGMTEAAHIAETLTETASRHGKCNPCACSLLHDKRFRHHSWQQWPFAIHAESFLGIERWWDEATRGVLKYDVPAGAEVAIALAAGIGSVPLFDLLKLAPAVQGALEAARS